MNLIMKKVTSWAAIIAVPTAITGWYGQNLPYPGFAKESGLITSAGLIVVFAVGLYVVFRAQGLALTRRPPRGVGNAQVGLAGADPGQTGVGVRYRLPR